MLPVQLIAFNKHYIYTIVHTHFDIHWYNYLMYFNSNEISVIFSYRGLKTDQALKLVQVCGQVNPSEKRALHLQPQTAHKSRRA